MSYEIQQNVTQLVLLRGRNSFTIQAGPQSVEVTPTQPTVEATVGNVAVQLTAPHNSNSIVAAQADTEAVELEQVNNVIDLATQVNQTEIQQSLYCPEFQTREDQISIELQPVISIEPLGDVLFYCDCTAAEEVDDCVYISADLVGGRPQVRTVDITDDTKIPCWGIIVEKASDTECTVRTVGPINGAFTGFTPRAQLVVGASGKPVHPGSLPASGPYFVQVVGVAIGSDSMVVQIDQTLGKII